MQNRDIDAQAGAYGHLMSKYHKHLILMHHGYITQQSERKGSVSDESCYSGKNTTDKAQKVIHVSEAKQGIHLNAKHRID